MSYSGLNTVSQAIPRTTTALLVLGSRSCSNPLLVMARTAQTQEVSPGPESNASAPILVKSCPKLVVSQVSASSYTSLVLTRDAVPVAKKYWFCRDALSNGDSTGKQECTPASNNGQIGFIDTGLVPGTLYYHTVQAVIAAGSASTLTGSVSAGTTITGVALGSATITATDNSGVSISCVVAVPSQTLGIAGSGSSSPPMYAGEVESYRLNVRHSRSVALDSVGSVHFGNGNYLNRTKAANDYAMTDILAAGGNCGRSSSYRQTADSDGLHVNGAYCVGTPAYLVPDAENNIFYKTADSIYRERKVAPSGIVTTIAGTGSAFISPANSGAGADAPASGLDTPAQLAVDYAGCAYFADQGNGKIRTLN